MNLGHVTVDSSFLVWMMEAGKPADVPCIAYLILGGDGPILVDTGFRDAEELTANSGFPFSQTADQTLDANLEKHGLRPTDIESVVFTHLHLDHTGHIGRLPNARFMIQRKEVQYAAAPYFPAVLYDRIDIGNLIGSVFDRIDFLEGDAEIAPGIRSVFTGGHSPGHQMLEVDVDSGLAMITGDNAYLAEPGVSLQLPPGYTTSIPETMVALARIQRDADHVLPMHDISMFTKYPDGVS
jgi:glyoxylase-like metal-dependent hydrolase (beta-lactamase superfamily II)